MRRRAWLLALLFGALVAEAREPLPPLPRLPLAAPEQAPMAQPEPIRPGPLVLNPRAPAVGSSPAPAHAPAPVPAPANPTPSPAKPSAKPAAPTSHARPRLALIIDDLGQTPERDRRVLALPATVALAIIPDTPTPPTWPGAPTTPAAR